MSREQIQESGLTTQDVDYSKFNNNNLKKYILKNFKENSQDIYINKNINWLKIEIDNNIDYCEGVYEINILFEDEYNSIDLNLKVLINIPHYITPNITFKRKKEQYPEIINIKNFYIELLQNRHKKVNQVSFDMKVSNVNYFFESRDIYVSRLLFNNSILKFTDKNIKIIWEISNAINNKDNITTFTIDKENQYSIEFQKASNENFSIEYIENTDKNIQIFPFVFKNCHINFKEISSNSIMPTIKFENCQINFKKTYTELNFLLINNCDLFTEKKLYFFNPVFYNIESLNKVKNISFFGNIKTKKKLDLIKYEDSNFFERTNIFNIILSYVLDFKLNIQLSFILLIFFILSGSVIFNQKDMAPADSVTIQTYLTNEMKNKHKDLNVESKQGWSYVDGYQQFNPILYSIDLSIPFLDLGQTTYWMPIFDDKRIFINSYFYFLKFISKFLLIFSIIKILDIWKFNEKGDDDE